jgi:hypothetical protein
MISRLSLALALALISHPAVAQPIPGLSEGETVAVIGAVLLIIFTAVGGYSIYAGLKNRRLSRESELWPTAGGTVLSSEVTKRTYRDPKQRTTTTYYAPLVRYQYRVGGTDQECTVIRFGDLESGDVKSAEAFVAKYPPGATVAVRYDPQQPSRATLETQSAGGAQIWTGAFFIVVPLIIMILIAVVIGFSNDRRNDLPPEVLEQLNQPN